MSSPNKTLTLALSESDKATIEKIAVEFGCTWGDKPNVSQMLRKIAQKKLKITWGDEAQNLDIKRAAILKAVSKIQEGLASLLRVID